MIGNYLHKSKEFFVSTVTNVTDASLSTGKEYISTGKEYVSAGITKIENTFTSIKHKAEGALVDLQEFAAEEQRKFREVGKTCFLKTPPTEDPSPSIQERISDNITGFVNKKMANLKQSVSDFFIQEPPESLYRLDQLFSILIDTPHQFNESLLDELYFCLEDLSLSNGIAYIKQLAPQLSLHELETFRTLFSLFCNPNSIYATEEGAVDIPKYIEILQKPSTKRLVKRTQTILRKILQTSKGVLVKLKEYGTEEGTKALAVLEKKITDEAHPSLLTSYNSCVQLQTAISSQQVDKIHTSAYALEKNLDTLFLFGDEIFTNNIWGVSDSLILREFRRRLKDFYSPQPPPLLEMLTLTRSAKPSLDRYYMSQAGGVQKLLNRALTSTKNTILDPALEQSGKLLKTNVDHLFGLTAPTVVPPTPTTPPVIIEEIVPTSTDSPLVVEESAPSISVPTPPPTSSEKSTASGFFNYCANTLQSMGTLVSQKTLGSVISIFKLGIDQLLLKIDPSDESSKQIVQNLLATLEKVKVQNNWTALQQAFTQAAHALDHLNICISGFNVPKFFNDPDQIHDTESVFIENMELLGQSQKVFTPALPLQRDWTSLALSAKKELAYHMSHLVGMKNILESTCKVTPARSTLYLELFNQARVTQLSDPEQLDIEATEAKLKELFFEEISKHKVGFFRKIYARISFYFFTHFVRDKIEKVATTYLNDIFNFIKEEGQQPDKFKPLQKRIIERLSGFFSILRGAYKRIAFNPMTTGRVIDMLKIELERKESNNGFETIDLYTALTDDILQKAFGSGIFAWIVKKWMGNPEEIIKSVVDKATQSFSDGCEYALDCVLEEQLNEILYLLQQHFAKNDPSAIASPENEEIRTSLEMKELVDNLFSILPKVKCTNVAALEKEFTHESITSRVNETIDNMSSGILEKLAASLTMAVQSFVKTDQLQKLTCQFARLTNKRFSLDQPISEKQMQEKEQIIKKRCDDILRLTISHAVDSSLDISGEIGNTTANSFIKKLHERSQEYFKGTKKEKGALRCMKDFGNINLIPLTQIPKNSKEANITKVALKNCMAQIKEQAKAYEQFCFDLQNLCKESTLTSTHKKEVNERYFAIAKQSQMYIRLIKEMERQTQKLCNHDIIIEDLTEIRKIPYVIYQKLFQEDLTQENLIWAQGEIVHLETLMNTLKTDTNDHAIVASLNHTKQELSSLLLNLDHAIKRSSLDKISIDQIVQQKKIALEKNVTDPLLEKNIAAIKQQLMKALDHGPLLRKCIEQLDRIHNEKGISNIESAHRTFNELLKNFLNENIRSTEENRLALQECFKKIGSAIDTSGLLDPQLKVKAARGLKRDIRVAKNSLKEFRRWEEKNIKPISHINFPIDKMKEIRDLGARLVKNRVGNHMNNLIALLRQPLIYYHVASHLMVIPYLESLPRRR